ncbi:MAG TPA: methyltransferase domain-containing protein [Dyella sp.]|uniref:methyltransferase domain-containing protein n=1 Tax=Dyella sp. TaxID=1869338 RepID=UPI002CF5CB95|nr:methyltransferase domain-containing protein [Dyella sp.]HTV84708.1 methyltransferase domain-containing protein [Dyella sp.]
MSPPQGPEPAAQPTPAGFYRALEDRFRGSRELILSRLVAYLPFIEPLKGLADVVAAVDLGCGRGEWLELLKQHGFEGQGVDVDAGMLHACRERGLQVTQGDAIEFLKALPNQSQMIVSGFHVAEHLPFEILQALIQEALRVLKPAGLLILETPNPENFKVSSLNFYLDPSHRNPLPPDLLAFVPEYYGFARVKIVRLQEDSSLLQATGVSLDQVLGGASPDYAVVAQKASDAPSLEAFNEVFQRDFGLPVSVLLKNYDSDHPGEELRGTRMVEDARRIAELRELRERVAFLDTENERREAALVGLREHLQEREVAWVALEREHGQLGESHRLLTRQIETLREREAALDHEVIRLRADLNTVYQSKSWRLTAPLRSSSKLARRAYTVLRRVAFLTVRSVARSTRPMLVRMYGWTWLRGAVVRVMGRDSRVVWRARLFLLGPASVPAEPISSEASLTRQASRILSVIDQVRADEPSAGGKKAPKKG